MSSSLSSLFAHCVLVLTLSGECVASLGGMGCLPGGVAVDADGFVYVTRYFSNQILVY